LGIFCYTCKCLSSVIYKHINIWGQTLHFTYRSFILPAVKHKIKSSRKMSIVSSAPYIFVTPISSVGGNQGFCYRSMSIFLKLKPYDDAPYSDLPVPAVKDLWFLVPARCCRHRNRRRRPVFHLRQSDQRVVQWYSSFAQ